MNRSIQKNEFRMMKVKPSFDIHDSSFNIHHSGDPRSGSALLIVLGVMAVLSVLVMEFGRSLRTDLKAAGGFVDEVQNGQLARSALAAAQLELASGASMYANATGDVYFVTSDDSAEEEIEALSQYRQGFSLGRGMFSYRFLMKPNALDIHELGAAALGRLFEVACGMEAGDERSALVDAILDWIDTDSTARAFGAEDDFYQALDPPRHCRNGKIETVEELLMVSGMTPRLLFGTGIPVTIEDGLLRGGGLYRFLIGDTCPEAAVSVQYILRGALPADNGQSASEEESEGFEKMTKIPAVLYLVAEGFFPRGSDGEGEAVGMPRSSRHMILVKWVLPENTASIGDYTVDDFQENAAGELIEKVLAYGVPEESDEL